jgi:hypothetical protein
MVDIGWEEDEVSPSSADYVNACSVNGIVHKEGEVKDHKKVVEAICSYNENETYFVLRVD